MTRNEQVTPSGRNKGRRVSSDGPGSTVDRGTNSKKRPKAVKQIQQNSDKAPSHSDRIDCEESKPDRRQTESYPEPKSIFASIYGPDVARLEAQKAAEANGGDQVKMPSSEKHEKPPMAQTPPTPSRASNLIPAKEVAEKKTRKSRKSSGNNNTRATVDEARSGKKKSNLLNAIGGIFSSKKKKSKAKRHTRHASDERVNAPSKKEVSRSYDEVEANEKAEQIQKVVNDAPGDECRQIGTGNGPAPSDSDLKRVSAEKN